MKDLQSAGFIVSDGLSRIAEVITQSFPNNTYQKCIVHLQSNLQSRVGREDKNELASDLREILSLTIK